MQRQPRAVMVPFGYPGYPNDLLDRFQGESADMVKSLGIELATAPRVTTWDDAAATAAELRKHDCDFVIVLILTWLEAPNVIETLQEQFHKPILLWSHTMFREKGEKLTVGPFPGVGVIRETFEELGLRFRFIWGMPEEQRVRDKVKFFSRVLSTMERLKHSRIGLLGYGSMGMYTAFFDHLSVKRDLGPEVDQVDQYTLVKAVGEMKPERVQSDVSDAKKNWEVAPAVQDNDLCISMKMRRALEDLAKERRWSALTVKCQYELSKQYCNVPCVPLSILGDQMPCSCEGDIPLIVTQLIMHYLSGGAVVTYGDIHDITEKDIVCGACGYAPFSLGRGKPKVDKTQTLYEGVANCTTYREGRVTMARLAYTRQRTYKMHITGGVAHEAEPFREVGCLPYPCMQVTLDGSPEHFGQHVMSQHYAILYGDMRAELMEFCDLMGIETVRT